ncbi:RNA polymerase sigma factor [Saprospiraceae bacterium]|nr:RNA polymerase sigma factor [Saprospiraceae bacterium]
MKNFVTILARVKKGDANAFREMVNTFSKRLMAVAKMMAKNQQDAQDILQESFISVFKKIHQFEGVNEHAFYAWMKKIVVNKSLALYKRKYYTHENRIELQDHFSSEPTIYKEFEREEFMKNVYALPVQYRQVVCLYAIEGYSHSEVSEMMGISESTSRSNYSRAKKKLSKIMNTPDNLFYKVN